MTREHVWPDWLSRTGFPNEPNVIESGPLNRLPAKYGPMRPLSTTVKAVCDKCNNGWMSRVEQAVQPVLTPILSGQRTLIDPVVLPTVALWALKTALIAMLLSQGDGDSPPVPPSDYVDVYNSRESFHPPESVLAWIGRYGHQEPRLSTQVTPVVFERNGGSLSSLPQAYVFSVLVGEVFVQGIRFTDRNGETSFLDPPGMARAWPKGKSLSWPLSNALSYEDWRQAQRGENLDVADRNSRLRPWDPAVSLPRSRLVSGMVQLPTMCGKHHVFYPADLVTEARRGRFYQFMTMCECGVAYLVETEPDGAHCKEADQPEVILSIYESLEGKEREFRDHGGTFTCKRIV